MSRPCPCPYCPWSAAPNLREPTKAILAIEAHLVRIHHETERRAAEIARAVMARQAARSL